MTLPLLYSYRRCPYAMRARMALLLGRHAFAVHEIVLRDKPAALLACSPKGTVPVLVLPGGEVVDESWAIMEWALRHSDAHAWWASAQSADNLALLQRNDGDFKRQLDRYKYPGRHADALPSREAHRALAVAALLAPLEARLQQAPHLGGAEPCATDLALFPFVRQFAGVEPAWFEAQPLPAVRAWLTGWVNSPLFLACMARVPAQAQRPFPALAPA